MLQEIYTLIGFLDVGIRFGLPVSGHPDVQKYSHFPVLSSAWIFTKVYQYIHEVLEISSLLEKEYNFAFIHDQINRV